ncbi:amidohydrolase/deacetylase family metallohydrolase [Paenibacillus xylanilyticus]|uniref:Amidohydrolase/deacetylase family metallohydrolase n=1 Tax=Paenibacillus xylanilyticus TaxID=248903 RepID=A0A7Y6C276_9BACL|nr:amidohydrolase/deacetylase family metallohydrolase [Paenibacillus xylanilyticus]NUU79214.1 amidohydrolase/deacetylase family metallohydrolase [Paenibacillus xylanilyticus]
MGTENVLRNLQLVDGRIVDIAIQDGMITAITPPGQAEGENGLDCSGLYVSSGWIDLHVHAVPELDPYGDEIDEIGVKQGVTTLVDAGSCGADRIGDLYISRLKADTQVFALLNISRIGLERTDELSQLEWIDRAKALEAAAAYPDFIVGLKARISQSVVKDSGIEPLKLARTLSEETKLPLMVHIGSAPPVITEVLKILQPGDVITHYLNGKSNNLFHADGTPLQGLLDAAARGVHLDVGHGTASFSFRIAEQAKAAGIALNTISTDIYRGNRLNGPVYSMSNVLTKFLVLGYSLEEVIRAVTSSAAEWLGKPELGQIRVGQEANLTLFALETGEKQLEDSEGDVRVAQHYIEAKGVFVNGSLITG